MKWIVQRTSEGISARESYPGVFLDLKADPNVLEWWEVDAADEDGAKDEVRKMGMHELYEPTMTI